MDTLVKSVIALHGQGLSLKQTAARMNCSPEKVKKILITAGLYKSPRSEEIARLAAEGLTEDQIADKLGISKKAVNTYTPYTRGMQNADYPTINALRIRKCRAKKKEKKENEL